MKITPAMIFVAVLVGSVSPRIAGCECVFVPPTFQPASQSIRIMALLDGKPMKDAHFDMFLYPRRYGDQPRYSFTANEKGAAAIRKIAPANYDVVVIANWGWTADIPVAVSRGEKRTDLSVKLWNDAAHALVERAVAAGHTARLTGFAGAVQDASGAAIPGSTITVWKVGGQHTGPGMQTAADNRGHFSIALTEGNYVALVAYPGFSSKAVVFEVSSTASAGKVDVMLEVASC
ncbi:MAG: carboxypeptidase regulatory-like domain-containing protein [Candidatus Acidiferrales bacterium]